MSVVRKVAPDQASRRAPATRIFINYRWEDGAYAAQLIFNRLSGRFGLEDVFFDVQAIPAGVKFPQYLRDKLAECEVLVTVIGEKWLDSRFRDGPKQGQRRLDDPKDWVRIEIETALADGKKLIPVLAARAKMPCREDLPPTIQELADWQSVDLRWGRDLDADLDRLVEELEGILGPGLPGRSTPRLWRMPHLRNRFFTGREQLLAQLNEELNSHGQAVISGLGGIGKTQLAVEYVYRYCDQYGALFWLSAETESDLTTGFLEIARLLDLPQKDAEDQQETVAAVLRWLQGNSGWLLVFDDAASSDLLKSFYPRGGGGRVLLTSRESVFDALGIAQATPVDALPPDEAVQFLLRRSGRESTTKAEEAAAAELAGELGFLPLALEQAAAYILAQQSEFQNYLKAYRLRRHALLNKSRPKLGDYPETVATTWDINFRRVQDCSPASAELLRACAFLSPDDIPLEAFVLGRLQWGDTLAEALAEADEDPLVIDELLEPLARYSLIRRDTSGRRLSLHKLVQEVLREQMDDEARDLWSRRAVLAVGAAFPEVTFEVWSICGRLLSQAKAASQLIEAGKFEFPEAGRLLNELAAYLHNRGQFAEAEPLYRRGLAIREKALGPDHPDVATSLNNLGSLCHALGRRDEAEKLYQRALQIREQAQGNTHPDVATMLDHLGELYRTEGKFAEAESLLQRSRNAREQSQGNDHLHLARTLNYLGRLYRDLRRDSEAEPLLLQALTMRRQALGADHPDVAASLDALGGLYRQQGRCDEAEKHYQQALATRQTIFGQQHPMVATSLNNLALVRQAQRSYDEAESLLLQARTIYEEFYGTEHAHVVTAVHNLGRLYYEQGTPVKYAAAASLFEEARAICEKTFGAHHPKVAACLEDCAAVQHKLGREAAARELRARVDEIRGATESGESD